MLRYLTAGESHGPALTVIGEGFPAGLPVSIADINHELTRRRHSVGRGGRGAIEPDGVKITSGVRHGKTLGTPVTLIVENKDWVNWTDIMAVEAAPEDFETLTRPRPGHADLAGALKMGHDDIRNVLERASARETTCRVAIGAMAKAMLAEFGIVICSHVTRLGSIAYQPDRLPGPGDAEALDAAPTRCLDAEIAAKMEAEVKTAAAEGDSLGGVFEMVALGLPVGIGSHVHWDIRLDALIAKAIVSIPAIKGVEIGDAFDIAGMPGSKAADQIYEDDSRATGGYKRSGNHMGGIEGGVSTGSPLIVKAAMKPLPTMRKPLHTVDMKTKEEASPIFERTDVTAVPRAAVVGESMLALVITNEMIRKFGGDSLTEMKRNYDGYISSLGQ